MKTVLWCHLTDLTYHTGFDLDKKNQLSLTKDLNKQLIDENVLILLITQKLVSAMFPLIF